MSKPKASQREPKAEELQGRVMSFEYKADSVLVISNAAEAEDEFQSFYLTSGSAAKGASILAPPFPPASLQKAVSENNALLPCIDAMETNIDGTGWVIEPVRPEDIDGDEADDPLKETLEAFFDEPWPGMSFRTMRMKLRRDIEKLGYGYLEVLRNAKGELLFVRHVDGRILRLVKLDDPVPVRVTVNRLGRVFDATVDMRQRRFAQVIRNKVVYFKEYGVERDLDKNTGEWAKKGESLSAQKRATELLYFVNKRDDRTAYGVPRWVNQMPSVLGSRKAEESNLKFFDAGGVPPVMVVVSGGVLATKTVDALNDHFNKNQADKYQAIVLEAYSTSGGLDDKSQVKVQVERFGAEQIGDSLFEKYDENSELRVRRAFRLPPIFVGNSSEYSFATAYTSYTVAEAQVFKPERDEFDEVINLTLMLEMDPDGKYKYRSLPLQVKDIQNQLKGQELLARNRAQTRKQLVNTVAEITSTEVSYDEDALIAEREKFTPPPLLGDGTGAVGSGAKPGTEPKPAGAAQPVQPPAVSKFSKADFDKAVAMAEEAVDVINGWGQAGAYEKLTVALGALGPGEMRLFKAVLAAHMYEEPDMDPEGLMALSGAALAVMHTNDLVAGGDGNHS